MKFKTGDLIIVNYEDSSSIYEGGAIVNELAYFVEAGGVDHARFGTFSAIYRQGLNTTDNYNDTGYDVFRNYIEEHHISPAIPNNPLSRVLYPDHVEWSENPDYLMPRRL